MTSKNPIEIKSDYLIVELNNIHPNPSVFVTASISDINHIASARWRYINGQVVTTKIDGQYELPISMANYLLDIPRKDAVIYRNENKRDFRRENLQKTSVKNSTITVHNGVAYIHCFPLKDGIQVMIDADQVEKVRDYRWHVVGKVRKAGAVLTIRTYLNRDGQKMSVNLTKLILGLIGTTCHVFHKNGNRLDCRIENLEVSNSKRD